MHRSRTVCKQILYNDWIGLMCSCQAKHSMLSTITLRKLMSLSKCTFTWLVVHTELHYHTFKWTIPVLTRTTLFKYYIKFQKSSFLIFSFPHSQSFSSKNNTTQTQTTPQRTWLIISSSNAVTASPNSPPSLRNSREPSASDERSAIRPRFPKTFHAKGSAKFALSIQSRTSSREQPRLNTPTKISQTFSRSASRQRSQQLRRQQSEKRKKPRRQPREPRLQHLSTRSSASRFLNSQSSAIPSRSKPLAIQTSDSSTTTKRAKTRSGSSRRTINNRQSSQIADLILWAAIASWTNLKLGKKRTLETREGRKHKKKTPNWHPDKQRR